MTFLYRGIFWNSSIYLCLVWRKSAKVKISTIYNVYGTVQNWMLWKSKNNVNKWTKLLDFHKIQEFQNWQMLHDSLYSKICTRQTDRQDFRNEVWNMKSFGCLFNTWFIYHCLSYNISLLVILLFSFDLDEWYYQYQ